MYIRRSILRAKLLKYLSTLLDPETITQFGKYLISGLSAAILEYSTFVILSGFFKLWYITSNSVGMFAGFILSFLLNRLWSFQSKDNIYKQLLLYSLLFAVNLGISNMLMYFSSDYLNMRVQVSKVIVMGFIVIWNFALYKTIIYRK